MMEQTLHELNADGLNMRLTNEKLFINSAGSSETFALRSISGVGIVDLIKEYNEELTKSKSKNNNSVIFSVVIFLLVSVISYPIFGNFFTCMLVAVIPTIIAYFVFRNKKTPTLKSAVRIMISGATRVRI